jgi:hypothetical protein
LFIKTRVKKLICAGRHIHAGQAPFGFTRVHFHNLAHLQVVSGNPVVETTLKLVGALISLEKPAQNQPNENK